MFLPFAREAHDHVTVVQNQHQHQHSFMWGVSQEGYHRIEEETLFFIIKLETALRSVYMRPSLAGKTTGRTVSLCGWWLNALIALTKASTRCHHRVQGWNQNIWETSKSIREPAELSWQPGWFSLIFVSLNDYEKIITSIYARMTRVLFGTKQFIIFTASGHSICSGFPFVYLYNKRAEKCKFNRWFTRIMTL